MHESHPETRLLFIGDIVGEAGVAFLEAELPRLRARYRPDFVIANAENAALTGVNPVGGAGMRHADIDRLFALDIDVPTGGNHSWDGQVTAVLGTHTHVATLDARVLPNGTAFVSDVGMTGPGGGMQGYAPEVFVQAMRTRMPVRGSGGWADGPMELGAVLVTAAGGRATAIRRLSLEADGGAP